MSHKYLKIHPDDNVLVALVDLKAGESISFSGATTQLAEPIPAKHKFVMQDMSENDFVKMYGVLVGKAMKPIAAGTAIGTHNVKHKSAEFSEKKSKFKWNAPDVTRWKNKTFDGYQRADGQVGTANYWIVIPMVFCENRNVNMIRHAFEEALGFSKPDVYKSYVDELVTLYRNGRTDQIASTTFHPETSKGKDKIFKNIDGIKFLTHEGGCGGTRQDSDALCALLAGYIHNPNVAVQQFSVLVVSTHKLIF
jgi:altronate hydrolase